MNFSPNMTRQVLGAIGIGVLLGCIGSVAILSLVTVPTLIRTALAPAPTPTSIPTPTPTITPTSTVPPTVTPAPTSTSPATRVPPANVTRAPTRVIVQNFVMARPVANTVPGSRPDPNYLYGTTRRGELDVHHGVEFVNPVGTLLYAVADGTVVVADVDNQPLCGENRKLVCGRDTSPETGGFYGKVVVIQLAKPINGQPIFALYGHMHKIGVSVGDAVRTGDAIGEIGGTGVAQGGAHLHFEVRVGVNDYASTRNPVLWLPPLPGRGALAGRYSDTNGNPNRGALINVYRANGDFLFVTETYSRDKHPEVNADEDLGENFAIGDLPAGDYILRVAGQQFAQRVTVQVGRLSFVELGIPQ